MNPDTLAVVSVVSAGSLGATTLPRLLGKLYREASTGLITIDHAGKGTSQLWIRDGYPVGCNVYAVFVPLGQVLMNEGMINLDDLELSLAEVHRTSGLQGEVLVGLGLITEAQLRLGLRKQHSLNLHQLLLLREGGYRLEGDLEFPAWTLDVALSPQESVLAVLRLESEEPRVDELLRLLGMGQIVLTDDWPVEWRRFEMEQQEYEVLNRLESASSVDEWVVDCGVNPVRIRQTMAAVYCFGLLRNA